MLFTFVSSPPCLHFLKQKTEKLESQYWLISSRLSMLIINYLQVFGQVLDLESAGCKACAEVIAIIGGYDYISSLHQFCPLIRQEEEGKEREEEGERMRKIFIEFLLLYNYILRLKTHIPTNLHCNCHFVRTMWIHKSFRVIFSVFLCAVFHLHP